MRFLLPHPNPLLLGEGMRYNYFLTTKHIDFKTIFHFQLMKTDPNTIFLLLDMYLYWLYKDNKAPITSDEINEEVQID